MLSKVRYLLHVPFALDRVHPTLTPPSPTRTSSVRIDCMESEVLTQQLQIHAEAYKAPHNIINAILAEDTADGSGVRARACIHTRRRSGGLRTSADTCRHERSARIDVLEIMFAEVAGFDLQHLLAVLLMLESKDALSVNKAVAKVVPGFVVPPPGPRPKEDASSKSFGEATTQQQLQQILMQQQRQQEMMMQRLQQVQQELQTVKAQAAAWPPAPQQHWPEEKCRLFLRSSGRRASASRPARDFEFDEAGICWLHGGRNRRGQAAPLLVHETTAARGELAQTSDDPMERAAAKVECARAKKWECTSAIRRQR
ncbi:hypothetical protein DIPPA_28843 [Diplonema papillatum]|nr:hypothetical protein DIPPA_28843 [Diplonema papillatum]